ncbi:MAG: MotE family protein [Chloroflexota bacterium]
MPDLDDEDERPQTAAEGGHRGPRLLPLILIFLLLIVAGGGFLAFRYVPAVRTAAQKLPVIGPLLGGVVEPPVDPLVADKLQLEQEKAATKALQDELAKLQADLQAKEAELTEREVAAQRLMAEAQAVKDEYLGKTATLDQQVKLYVAMKPDKAAAVMNELPDSDVARILARMDSATAAKILAYLQPARAAKILTLMGS